MRSQGITPGKVGHACLERITEEMRENYPLFGDGDCTIGHCEKHCESTVRLLNLKALQIIVGHMYYFVLATVCESDISDRQSDFPNHNLIDDGKATETIQILMYPN